MNGTYRTIRTVLSALCLMVLLCSCFPALAEDAWTCPSCGQTGNTGNFCPQCGAEKPSLEWTCPSCGQTGNTGNFCPQCGKSRYAAQVDVSLTEEPATVRPTATPRPTFTPTPKPTATPRPTYTPTPRPTATPSVKLASSVSYRDGKTTIKWSGTNDSCYVLIKAINGSSEQHIWNLGSSSSGSLTSAALMPGKKYEVTLTTFFSTLDTRTYTVPDVPLFEDGKLKNTSVKVSIEPRRLAKGDEYSNAKKVNGLSASKIISAIQDGNESYGFKYQMRMPQLAKPRTFYVTIYIESPDGYLDAESWGDITFDRVNNGYQTIWFHFLGGDYFKDLYDTTGNVPAGNYKITMYWDGMFVNESVLKISK